MKKNTLNSASVEWNQLNKESWHYDFEAELVNDEKWSCIVTAAVQATAEDEECVQMFCQSVATGLRSAIKTVSMADVLEVLKKESENNMRFKRNGKIFNGNLPTDDKALKFEKLTQSQKEKLRGYSPQISPIISLAARYAKFTDFDCKLPPDLMAGVLKYLILNLKRENIRKKKVDIVKERKLRRRNIKANFIKSMKPFQLSQKTENNKETLENSKPEPVRDEPYPGPDLYIVLIDFYNPLHFTELLRINVPFLALLKISNFREIKTDSLHKAVAKKTESFNKKEHLVSDFWRVLTENCETLENTTKFKDFMLMEYQPQYSRLTESKRFVNDIIFDEISWILYNAYMVHRQHQTYLQEMVVQRTFVSLETLNLSECTIYNQLCDALVTGAPNTVLLILYAMVEQVICGVPLTESAPLEYKPANADYFLKTSNINDFLANYYQDLKKRKNIIPTSCLECRCKQHPGELCIHSVEDILEKSEGDEVAESSESFEQSATVTEELSVEEPCVTESLILESLCKKKELKKEKNYTSPLLCLYGDKITIQNYHCDSKLIDSMSIAERLIKNTDLAYFWSNYPEMTPGAKAFYNFHFLRFQSITKDSREVLKNKVLFALSMKFLGIIKSYFYNREEENLSDLFSSPHQEKDKKLSKVKFDQHGDIQQMKDGKNFDSCVFKTFVSNTLSRKKITIKSDNTERFRGSFLRGDSVILQKANSLIRMSIVTHRNSGFCFAYNLKTDDSPINTFNLISPADKKLTNLYSLLDCYEISNLSEPQMFDSQTDYINLITNFNFFEVLETERMVQRLLDVQQDFNTSQCSYFAPLDTLIIIMHNDSDYRGIFFTRGYGTLSTPVALRDFYNHVYEEINDWLVEEKEKTEKFVAYVEEKLDEFKEKEDSEYLSKLKKKFNAMSPEEKKEFLEADFSNEQQPNFKIKDEELCDLPNRLKPELPNRISFVTTNLIDVRVETQRKVNEFYSKDGAEISVMMDSWLYNPTQLMTLSIKQSQLRFLYHQWLGKELNTTFSLKTITDIIFVFYKTSQNSPEENDSRYHVKMSWPTGLIMNGISLDKMNMYVKQSYLADCNKLSETEKEKSRCFLRNGEILVFRENGEVDVLCASGTKHILKKFKISSGEKGRKFAVTEYQTTATTGEVFRKTILENCNKTKTKLIETLKVYIGVDSKNQETFYKREDGTLCMLWPNGKLVTTFQDGTKITSVPDFDSEEIAVEWTEKEKLYMEQIESKYREEVMERKPKSKTMLKNLSPDTLSETSKSLNYEESSINQDGFVSVSLSYIMEHPKYSRVCYDLKNPTFELAMPNQVTIKMDPQGNYLINQENNFLKVQNDNIEFYTTCNNCKNKSAATINLNSKKILCEFTDFFGTMFHVYRNGETIHTEAKESAPGCFSKCLIRENDKNHTEGSSTREKHVKKNSQNQRCFALERDLSGIEFIHAESLAQHCYHLPSDTYYDLHSKGTTDSTITHSFSCPYYKIGYENWEMEYEDKGDFLPTNLKKKDLKELRMKDNFKKLFRYPCPNKSEKESFNNLLLERSTQIPKIVVTRTIKCFSENPKSIIDELKGHVTAYQEMANKLCKEFKKNNNLKDSNVEDVQVKGTLEKIAVSLNHKFIMHPHVSTQIPSTEKDIHCAGHYINLINELKLLEELKLENLPKCKQIAISFPRFSSFPPIEEESDSF